MKTKNKFLVCMLSLLIFMGCDPSLVDKPPMGATEESYFSTVEEFRSQLVGVYAALYGHYHFSATGWNGWVTSTWLLPGDDLTESQGARTSVELFDGSLNPGNAQIRFTFQTAYKLIARANVTLDKVENVDYSNYTGAEEIAGMRGEALFLRGYTYFKLFNIFGSVPVISERLPSVSSSNTPKSPALEVLSQAIEDARGAIQYAPDSWDEENRGRVTKDAARGLLAKALVFRANYTGNSSDYQEAIAVFNSIDHAELVPDYIDNFNSYTENNAESLFEIQAAQGTAQNNLNLANDGAWRGVENMSVYRGYMMEFGGRGDFNDGSSTKFMVTDKLLNNFGHDPRIQVFLNPEDGLDGKLFQKYNLPAGVNHLTPSHGGSANNERVLRYADLKLLIAEAELKTGNIAAAISHINDVRTRAREWGAASVYGNGTIPANLSTGESNATTVMQWIMDERFVELAGEGHRWWDLKRWHVSGEINLSGWGGGDEHFSTALSSPVQFDVNKHLLFPLPQVEIERNSAITENNPGY